VSEVLIVILIYMTTMTASHRKHGNLRRNVKRSTEKAATSNKKTLLFYGDAKRLTRFYGILSNTR